MRKDRLYTIKKGIRRFPRSERKGPTSKTSMRFLYLCVFFLISHPSIPSHSFIRSFIHSSFVFTPTKIVIVVSLFLSRNTRVTIRENEEISVIT